MQLLRLAASLASSTTKQLDLSISSLVKAATTPFGPKAVVRSSVASKVAESIPASGQARRVEVS